MPGVSQNIKLQNGLKRNDQMRKLEMDLSIIIPCHNLENFITPLLTSFKKQKLHGAKVQLIFVCDCCTDKTKEVILKHNFFLKLKYKEVLILECDVKSCGLARNVGMKEAKGKYIWFVDGDDWLTDTHSIYTFLYYFNYYQTPIIRFDYIAPNFMHKGHPSMVWQYGYLKEFIKDIPFKEIQPNEDLIFNQEVSKKWGQYIPYIDKTLYHYNYMREGSNVWQMKNNGKIEP